MRWREVVLRAVLLAAAGWACLWMRSEIRRQDVELAQLRRDVEIVNSYLPRLLTVELTRHEARMREWLASALEDR